MLSCVYSLSGVYDVRKCTDPAPNTNSASRVHALSPDFSDAFRMSSLIARGINKRLGGCYERQLHKWGGAGCGSVWEPIWVE